MFEVSDLYVILIAEVTFIFICSSFMDLYLYLYSTFLVLMTTQSTLQYSFSIHPVTHTFIQCIY